MPLRDITATEVFDFETADALRDWFNRFEKTDLSGVPVYGFYRGPVRLTWETEKLSDGSEVSNIRFS